MKRLIVFSEEELEMLSNDMAVEMIAGDGIETVYMSENRYKKMMAEKHWSDLVNE